MTNLTIKSPASELGKQIPRNTCDEDDINPPLNIEDTPKEAKMTALTLDDSDAPSGTFDYCFLWNIPASTEKIAENPMLGNREPAVPDSKAIMVPARLQPHIGISSLFTLKLFSNLKSELAEPF